MITCDQCTGLCCREIDVYLEKPTSEDDYLDIFWYLFHQPITIYIDYDDEWWIRLPFPCKHVQPDGKCGIYLDRPPICRNSPVSACQRNKPEVKMPFPTTKAYANWLIKNKIVPKEKIPEVYLQ